MTEERERETEQLNLIEPGGEWGPEEALYFLGEPQAQWHRAIIAERVYYERKNADPSKPANTEWLSAIEMLHEDVLDLVAYCGEILASSVPYVLTFEPCNHPELFKYVVSVLRRSGEHSSSVLEQVISRTLCMSVLPDTIEEFVEMRKSRARGEAIEGVRELLAAQDEFESDLDAQVEAAAESEEIETTELASPANSPSNYQVPEHEKAAGEVSA